MSQETAWVEVFYLCLSLGMQTEGKTGLEAVKSFIIDNAKAVNGGDLTCVFCGKALHEYGEHCLIMA